MSAADLAGRLAELSPKKRELLSEFQKLSSENTQPEAMGFFSKVKEFIDGMAGNRQSGT